MYLYTCLGMHGGITERMGFLLGGKFWSDIYFHCYDFMYYFNCLYSLYCLYHHKENNKPIFILKNKADNFKA